MYNKQLKIKFEDYEVKNLEKEEPEEVYGSERTRKLSLAGDRIFIKQDIRWLYILQKELGISLSELLRLRYKDFDFNKHEVRLGKKKLALRASTSKPLHDFLAGVKGRLGNERAFFTYSKDIETALAFILKKRKTNSGFRYAQN